MNLTLDKYIAVLIEVEEIHKVCYSEESKTYMKLQYYMQFDFFSFVKIVSYSEICETSLVSIRWYEN